MFGAYPVYLPTSRLSSHPLSGLCAFLRRLSLRVILLFAVLGLSLQAWAAVPSYVVTVNTDTTNGSPGNCTNQNLSGATPDVSCSLRDALAASETGGGNITFSATVFGAAQPAAKRTITLANGTLNIPSNTMITGLTTGTGATLTNLVTVNTTSAVGYNQKVPLITVASGVTNATIGGLTITGGVSRSGSGGGDILNHGALTITSCTISNGNTAGANGGGIYNDGTLFVDNSTISGNITYTDGGGIYNTGTLTVTTSTIAGNTALSSGGGIYNIGTLTLVNATIADGVAGSVTSSTNSLLSGSGLAPLGNYGGPTQTAPPLPGSAAICAGVSTAAITDQRGLPRTTTYGTTTCIDSGAVQTNYSLSFNPQPSASVPAGANFAAGIQLSESGNPFKVSGIAILLALGAGDAGSLNISSLTTNSVGVAKSSNLQVGEPGTDDSLVATLTLTASGVTPALSRTATSSPFTVAPSNVQVTLASAPAGLMVTADGVSYSAPVTLTWAVGSQHTLAVTSPQSEGGGQYTFASWSDGGSASHTVNATTDTTTYTATFTATMYQLNIAANPTSEGTITSPSGNYYALGTVVSLIAIPNAGYRFVNWTGATTGAIANPNLSATTITMNAPESVTANFAALPSPIVVTTTSDDATGTASNCPSASNCSLRDAIAAATAAGVGNITFDSHVFATPQTITLGTGGGLTIPSNTTINITGPTTGSGASLKNLVTVSGGGPVFTVNTANAVISNLTITGGNTGNYGGGILNNGVLTVSNSAISGNSASTDIFSTGGGIENFGTLTLIDSTVSGNSVSLYTSGNAFGASISGGGIDNQGTLTMINSTVSGNNASLYITYNGSATGPIVAIGGGINNLGTLTMTNSTVAGNSVNGYGIVSNPGLYVGLAGGGIFGNLTTSANNIISGNTNNGSEDDCDNGSGPNCPTSGQNGNFAGPNVPLAPLANYGGPTQTQLPLPGSPAICGGLIADIAAGTTTDQRGLPRKTTYGSNPTCVDSGSVQTNYSLSFSTEPPSTIPATTNFTAAVQVKESGNAVPVSGISVLTALATGDKGTLNVSSLSANSAGIASDSQFQISLPGNDKLVATLPVTATGVTPAATVSATSTAVNVTPSSGIEVTVGVSPAGVTFMVDGVSYTATTTLTWPVGSQHTLAAMSPQGSAGTQYTFASWSDGGAATHTVTASTSTIDYTVTFNKSYLLTTSVSPSQGGTVSPVTGYFPANSFVSLTAIANPGYAFTSWTGNVSSASSSNTGISMTAPQAVTANFGSIPIYTVNTNLDDSTGTAANCTGGGSTCSLRDALAAAAAATSGADIQFNPTVFAASQPASARTIVLGSAAGTLNVPDNTRIFGPTTGSGATLTQLVTINGENLSGTPIFSTGGDVVLSGLAIVDDANGAINNSGALTVIDCMISGNSGGGISNSNIAYLTVMGTTISGNSSGQGGGIYNQGGTVTVIGSVIAGNSGGGIFSGGFFPGLDAGNVTIVNSTITGNNGTGIVSQGGVNQNVPPQSLTIANSTISGNTGGGVDVEEGIDLNTNNYIPVTLTVTDSILSGNTSGGSADCTETGTTCPTNGQNGNLVGAGALLAPLANYGGPTQTQPPLPGSPAICAGVIADIPAGTTTDQRGYPRTTTYGSNPPCVDSGAVQTHYSLSFSTEPPTIVAPNTNFTAAVKLSDNGNPFPLSGLTIPLVLGPGSTGTLSGSSAATASTGIATYSALQVNEQSYSDSLVATLPLTASGITPAASAGAVSTVFDVQEPGSPVAKPVMSPPSGTYTSAQMVTIASATPGATIYYTTDGTIPSRLSKVFNPASPILVSSTETIKAYAVLSGYALSSLGVANYSIIPPYAPTPTFSLAAGFYDSSVMVRIMDSLPGATIHYTTDHTTPTTSSPVYNGPITISSTERLQAIAVAPNYSPSAVAQADYYIATAEPVISLPSGKYTGTQMVSITDATSGAVIYYTTDGTTPSRSSPIFHAGSPISVSSSETIKAIAVANGYTASPEAVANYTITP